MPQSGLAQHYLICCRTAQNAVSSDSGRSSHLICYRTLLESRSMHLMGYSILASLCQDIFAHLACLICRCLRVSGHASHGHLYDIARSRESLNHRQSYVYHSHMHLMYARICAVWSPQTVVNTPTCLTALLVPAPLFLTLLSFIAHRSITEVISKSLEFLSGFSSSGLRPLSLTSAPGRFGLSGFSSRFRGLPFSPQVW